MTKEKGLLGNLTRNDLLIGLIEECGEVIQAATKCLRFGFDSDHDIGYGRNDHRLAFEIGDVLGIIEALPLNRELVDSCAATKVRRLGVAKSRFGVTEGNTQHPVVWLKNVGSDEDPCYVPVAKGDPGAFPVYR